MQYRLALADFEQALSTNVNISDYELQILKNSFVEELETIMGAKLHPSYCKNKVENQMRIKAKKGPNCEPPLNVDLSFFNPVTAGLFFSTVKKENKF